MGRSLDSTTLVVVTARAGDDGPRLDLRSRGDRPAVETSSRRPSKPRRVDVQASWAAMVHAIRNEGRPGLSSMAIAAVNVALWDLKAELLGVPLSVLLGRHHERCRSTARRLHLLLR